MIANHFPEQDLDATEYEDYPHHLTVEEAQRLADAYSIDNETMRVCKEEFDLAHDEWMAFRQAHSLRHSQPTVVDPGRSIDEAVSHLSQRQKRQATERKAKQRHRRERDAAARQWWQLEDALDEATELWTEDKYTPPKPTLTIGLEPPEPGAVLLNAQDWHVGKRSKHADEGIKEYVESVKDAFVNAIETSMRMRRIDTLYFVMEGNLVHVDGPQGTTKAHLRTSCASQERPSRQPWSWWFGASTTLARD